MDEPFHTKLKSWPVQKEKTLYVDIKLYEKRKLWIGEPIQRHTVLRTGLIWSDRFTCAQVVLQNG